MQALLRPPSGAPTNGTHFVQPGVKGFFARRHDMQMIERRYLGFNSVTMTLEKLR